MKNATIPLSITKRYINQEVQTTTSVNQSDLFNFDSDIAKLEANTPYKFVFKPENVERLVSAVQGDDEAIRSKAKILNPKTRRFRHLIKSLKNQIEMHQIEGSSRRGQLEFVERLSLELARAIDPASRHGKLPTLYGHQKYEHPIKIGKAIFRANGDEEGKEEVEYDAIYTYNQNLYLTNNKNTFFFENVLSHHLTTDKEIEITFKRNRIGSIFFYDGEIQSEEQPNLSVIEPISDDERALFLVHGLGSCNNQMNLKTLINPYDFSFIDVVLSIPELTVDEAKGLLTYLYKSNYLSAFIRSKLCQFLYETARREKSSIRGSASWPELLGRLVSFLNHEWYLSAAQQIDRLELPQVVKSLTKLSPPTLFILDIILTEYKLLEKGDTIEFLWDFLCRGLFANLYLSCDDKSIAKRRRLEALYQGTKEKPPNSKTRIITEKVIEVIHNKGGEFVFPTQRFSSLDFLHNLVTSHPDEILLILKNIPRKVEEASPLFYPIALEVRDALEKYDDFDPIDNAPEDTGIISNVDYRQSDTESLASRSSASTNNTNKKITTKGVKKNGKAKKGAAKGKVTASPKKQKKTEPVLLSEDYNESDSGSLDEEEPVSPNNERAKSPKANNSNSKRRSNNNNGAKVPINTRNNMKAKGKSEEKLSDEYSYVSEEDVEYDYVDSLDEEFDTPSKSTGKKDRK